MTHSRAAVLVLSGGGAWGAYGAGFLDGWAKRPAGIGDRWPARPTFDVVTGVSTGAIMAPFALLGSGSDPKLQQAFRGVSGDDLFTSRSLIAFPWWNSLKDPNGLERQLRDALDSSTIADLKAAAAQHRTIWVGAVNFDTGKFTQFNLSALARDLPPAEAKEQIVNHIMASSALPTFFPPRFINGCMYMDGGVRENAFFTRMHDAVGTPGGTKENHADIYVIANGPIEVQKLLAENTLLDIVVRSFSLAESQFSWIPCATSTTTRRNTATASIGPVRTMSSATLTTRTISPGCASTQKRPPINLKQRLRLASTTRRCVRPAMAPAPGAPTDLERGR